jgi:hypothetical protein
MNSMTHSHPSHAPPEDILTLPSGGYVSVALPETLSKAEYEELRDWLKLMQRKAERKVVDQPTGPARASDTSETGDSEASSREDGDSLSWE